MPQEVPEEASVVSEAGAEGVGVRRHRQLRVECSGQPEVFIHLPYFDSAVPLGDIYEPLSGFYLVLTGFGSRWWERWTGRWQRKRKTRISIRIATSAVWQSSARRPRVQVGFTTCGVAIEYRPNKGPKTSTASWRVNNERRAGLLVSI
jgi:hypothetical protein